MLGHHVARGGRVRSSGREKKIVQCVVSRTVDGDGNALGESEAVLANKGGDLAKGVGLEVLGGSVANLSLNNVEVNVVGLSHSADGRGSSVVL